MRTHTLNECFFDHWTKESAYVFGWLVSDGCVARKKYRQNTEYTLTGINIGLQLEDKYILESIAELCGYNGPIRESIREYNGKTLHQATLAISSQKMAQSLVRLGLEPAKSLTMKWFDNIPLEFMSRFIQGFYEGDGSVFLSRAQGGKHKYPGINFTGTKDFLEGLKQFINLNILPEPRGYIRVLKIPSGTYYQLVYSGMECLQLILNYIYQDSTPDTILKRKYEKYEKHIKDKPIKVKMRTNYKSGVKSTEKHMFVIFEEEKSILEWVNDPRSKVQDASTFMHRIQKLKMTPEQALTTEYQDVEHKNVQNGKLSNRQKYTMEAASRARKLHLSGIIVKKISASLNIPESAIHDMVQNRTFFDSDYMPKAQKSEQIMITYNNQTHTIREWSEITGIAYSTIDRRHRQGLPVEQILEKTNTRLKLGKAQSNKDAAAYELAKQVREDYKNGIVGKENYEKHNIKKSKYIDLIGNRTCKEENIWWK